MLTADAAAAYVFIENHFKIRHSNRNRIQIGCILIVFTCTSTAYANTDYWDADNKNNKLT